MNSSTLSGTSNSNKTIGIVAWSLTILLSWFPDILYYEITGNVPIWLGWVKVGLVFTFIALSFLWKEIRALRNYALVIGVLWLLYKMEPWIRGGSWFQSMSNDLTTISSRHLLGEFLDFTQAVIMIVTLFVLLRQFRRFFFAKGDTRVDTEPLPLLGVPAGMSVRTFSAIFTLFLICGSFGLLLAQGPRPSLSMVIAALPLLPIIIFAALLNSFSEEVMFRSSLLSVSHEVVGKGQAIWMAAFIFGSAHYIGGQPSLLLGFVISLFVGWAWGKVMLESQSILLPWSMHFVANAITFFFNEMGTTRLRPYSAVNF